MSDHRKYSPSSRAMAYNNSDDDYPSSTRDKFRRERSLDGGSYMDSYQPKTDEYGRYSRSKRHLRSPSPTGERRHKYRRTSPNSPLPPHHQHHSHHHHHQGSHYRGSTYSRHKRDRSEGRDQDHVDGDHYIPNYDRDGYTPGARYGMMVEQKQQNHQYQYHHNQQQNSALKAQHQSNTQKMNYENATTSMAGGNWSTLSRIPLIDPHQLDYVVSFKQYCDYLRQTNPKLTDDEFQTRYDDYKEMISIKQLPQFFANNKEKQWFLEKYHPQLSKARVDDTKQRRLHNLTTFMQALQHGDYDAVYYDSKDTDMTSNNDGTAEELNTDNNNIDDTLSNKEAFDNHLVIKTVPPTISRQKIIDMCNKVDGFQYLALSEPSVTKKFHRIGWIHFSEETDMQKVFDELDNQKIDDFTFHLAMNRKNQSTSGRSRRTAPDITNTPERLSVDLDQATQLAKVMDAELEKEGLQDVINRARSSWCNSDTVGNNDHSDLSMDEGSDHLLETKKELDMILVYLRYVHMYCYYCGLECDSTEELNRKCLDPHHRKVSTGGVSDQKQVAKNERLTQQWIKSLDQRIRMKVHPLNDEDLVKAGGRSLKSETDAYLSEHIQKEHDAKFKCKVGDCAKAFKGVEFVEKHIVSKHGDEIQRIKDDVMYYNNYVCDPNHLVMATNNNNTGNSNNNGMNGGGTMGNVMTGSDNNNSNSNNNAHSGGGAPPYVLTLSPNGLSLQAASLGTPWDKIPRIGFGGNVGWPASMAGRLGARMGGGGGGGKGPISHPLPASTSEMMLDMPQDPRQVKSYIDLDAPTDDGDNISFY